MPKKQIFKTALVEKRNVLNEIRKNNMTLQELRFFSIYLARINHMDISSRAVRFPLVDFQKIMDFGRLNIEQLRNSTADIKLFRYLKNVLLTKTKKQTSGM